MPTASDDASEPRTDPDTAHAIADAIADLGAEGDFLARGLLKLLRSLPAIRHAALSDDQRAFFIKSHSMTEEQLHHAEQNVARGALLLKQIETWANESWRTIGVREAAALLQSSEDELRAAVARGSLMSVTIGDEERIPHWQLNSRAIGELLPHLDAVLPALLPNWSPTSISAFFHTRQEDLREFGTKTPAAWLEDGGDPEAILQIIETAERR
ncbi:MULTISPECIES: hypothetical protein [unclassified Curtobacterium]|uniref:hypothetical protein n=1 Tax=unclassified Curtobacterium TaxID=257496 RepID=UPI0039AF6118